MRSGLKPGDRLLDLGCGALRCGRMFFPFLDRGNYWGIDLSPKTIDYASDMVAREFPEKEPVLRINEDKDLKFGQFGDQRFDAILAKSVFTHLFPEMIRECFDHVHKIMAPSARFFFIFPENDKFARRTVKDF